MSVRRSNILLIIVTVIAVNLAWPYLKNFYYVVTPFENKKERNVAKLEEVLRRIDAVYVDEVNWEESIQGAIKGTLNSLDPHSVYIPKREAEINEENFQGRYQGIGIQFDVIEGYITVISVIPGSPSEEVGLLAGDRIITIEGKSAYNISTADVPKKLKGPKGTTVTITVSRVGVEEQIEFKIKRDEIPIFTIHTYFMADDSIGYVWMNRFASNTADELETALIELERQGMKRLLLDLRDNGGGFLNQAVQVAGKFISGHKLIVYTQGRDSNSETQFYSDDFGSSINRNIPLVILINENSASASEIVAGAVQDYDRGLIVGKNSFGKGLVQNEFELNDGSRLRLTVSKYYTPSGRLIQRPYKNQSREEYYYNGTHSIDSTYSDSLLADSLSDHPVYYTEAGRKVLGGGGITPDIEIEYEVQTSETQLVQQLFRKRIFFEVATQFVNRNPKWKNRFVKFMKEEVVSDYWLDRLVSIAREREISIGRSILISEKSFFKNRIKAEIARNLWGMSKYYQVILQSDSQYIKALEYFDQIEQHLSSS